MRKRPPSIGDREPLRLEYSTIRPAQRAPDRYDMMYERRVAEKAIIHKTSRELWRGGKSKGSLSNVFKN